MRNKSVRKNARAREKKESGGTITLLHEWQQNDHEGHISSSNFLGLTPTHFAWSIHIL